MAADAEPFRGMSRRSFLQATAGLAGAGAMLPTLAACGSPATDEDADTTPNTVSPSATATELVLTTMFDPNTFITAGPEQRAVVTVVDRTNTAPAGLPGSIVFSLVREGQSAGPPVTVERHADGVPKPYFPVPLSPPEPGLYAIRADVAGGTIETLIQVKAASDTNRPTPGKPMTVADSPTTADPRGVTPLCTQPEPCPLHRLNLRDALATGRPTALLISTPRYCQIGVCGPVLALVLEQQAAYPNVQFIHAEVFTDPASGSRKVAPLLDALDLDYEPMFAVIGADGIVRARLDNVFDRTEVKAALDMG